MAAGTSDAGQERPVVVVGQIGGLQGGPFQPFCGGGIEMIVVRGQGKYGDSVAICSDDVGILYLILVFVKHDDAQAGGKVYLTIIGNSPVDHLVAAAGRQPDIGDIKRLPACAYIDIAAVVGDGKLAGVGIIADGADARLAETVALAIPFYTVVRRIYGKEAIRGGAEDLTIGSCGESHSLVIRQVVPPVADGRCLRPAGEGE